MRQSRLLQLSPRILIAALAFGLITGLVEGAGFVVLQKLNWLTTKIGLIDVSIDILWIAIVFAVVFFLLIGAFIALLRPIVPDRLLFKAAVLVFAFLAFFDWLTVVLFGRVRVYAIVLLALGVAVQVTRMITRYEDRLFSLWRPLVLTMVLVALLLGVGVRSYQFVKTQRSIASLPPHTEGTPNIVLIVVDTLRADHLSSYGYRRKTSPNIDELASGGALFENAFSASSWTLPSHVSLLTGLDPTEHNADWSNPTAMRESNYSTLAEVLKTRGYRTAGFSSNLFWVTHQYGIDRGFIHFEDYFHSISDMGLRTIYGRAIEALVLRRLGYEDIPARRRAAVINDSVLQWVSNDQKKPFFVFINYMDVHDPYLPPAPYRQKYSDHDKPGGVLNWRVGRSDPPLTSQQLEDEINAYDGAISYVDQQIGNLVSKIRNQVSDNTIFIITSDHGEMFGEHNLYLHGHSLYRSEIHVPLIVNYPNQIPANRRVAQPVSNTSVAATVMALVAKGDQKEFPGLSLSDLWDPTTEDTEWPSVVSYVARQSWVSPKLPVQHGSIHSLISQEWHYIENDRLGVELYRWKEDPLELNNLAKRPELQHLIRSFRREVLTLDEETVTRVIN